MMNLDQCVPATGTTASSTNSVVATTTRVTTTSTSTAKSSQTSSIASSTSSAPTSSATQYFITLLGSLSNPIDGRYANKLSSGDSYSQTGFEINGTLANAGNPLGNPAFPGYTTCGGANWIGRLVSEYNLSTLLSYNFAYGGATTDASLVAPFEASVLSFVDQVTEFSNSIASHPPTTPWTSKNTLVGVWMGVNDVGGSYYQSNVTDILDAVMAVYFKQLQTIYNAGARNFVLLSVPRESQVFKFNSNLPNR